MQASLTSAARSAPLKPWQWGLATTAATSTSTARGVFLVRACRMAPLPSGGGRGTYRILSSRPGLYHNAATCNCGKHRILWITQMQSASVSSCLALVQVPDTVKAYRTAFRDPGPAHTLTYKASTASTCCIPPDRRHVQPTQPYRLIFSLLTEDDSMPTYGAI